MKTLLFIILLYLCNDLVFSQSQDNKPKNTKTHDYITNYYPSVYNAYYEYHQKNYEETFKLYQKAFEACPPINIGSFNELGLFIRTCAILEKNDLAAEYLKKVLLTGDELKYYLEDSLLNKVWDTPQGLEIITNYDDIRAEYISSINMPLRERFAMMQSTDQQYRDDTYGYPKEQSDLDKTNAQLLMEIFEKYGYYPNRMIIGNGCPEGPPTCPSPSDNRLLLHTNDSIKMNYFIPKLQVFVNNGTCNPRILGSAIDRIYLNKDEPFIMGTYYDMDENFNTTRAKTIPDLEQVDRNRISIGLPPLYIQDVYDSIFLGNDWVSNLYKEDTTK